MLWWIVAVGISVGLVATLLCVVALLLRSRRREFLEFQGKKDREV